MNIKIMIAVSLACVFCLCSCGNVIAAYVGDIYVYQEEVDNYIAANPSKTEDDAIEDKIKFQLMRREIVASNIRLTDEEISSEVERLKNDFAEKLLKDSSECSEILAYCQDYGMPWESYFELEAVKYGIAYNLILPKYFSAKFGNAYSSLSENEKEKYVDSYIQSLYDEVKADIVK